MTMVHEGRQHAVPSLREQRYSQSLERGLAILSCFTAEEPVRGVASIADGLGMSRSTTHRYLSTMVELGYVDRAGRQYRLGLRVADLGMSALAAMPLRQHAQPHLEELAREVGLTTQLAVLNDREVLGVSQVIGRRGRWPLNIGLQPGMRQSPHCTASGKLLLAHLPELEQREVISELHLAKCGPNTITTKKGLREELDMVREVQLAGDDEESAADAVAVAVPIRDEAGAMVAAVSLSATTAQTSPDGLGELVPQLSATANRISTRLGFRQAHERVTA